MTLTLAEQRQIIAVEYIGLLDVVRVSESAGVRVEEVQKRRLADLRYRLDSLMRR